MKKNGLKRFMALGMGVVMVASMAACSSKDSSSNSKNSSATAESTATQATEITFPLQEKATLSFITGAEVGSTQEPNERTIFKRLEEATNVHIDWTCFSYDQFADKKNLALAQASDLPDGLFNAQMSTSDLLRFAKQGVIIPVNDLIEQNMPNLKAILDENPEYLKMITASDGNIYSFPWFEQLGSDKEAIQSLGDTPYINKVWLDALGLELPTTTDELITVLQAFKDHPEVTGEDCIPMACTINDGDQDPYMLMGAFGEGYGDVPDHIAVTNDKEVIYTAVQQGYYEGIEYLHKINELGLMDPEAFTQDWATFVAKGKAGRYGLFFTWDSANIVENQDDYVSLPVLAGPDGMKSVPRQSESATSGVDVGRCVLTSACEDTALAAAWIDQMYSPLQSVQNNWGTYGDEEGFNIFELTEEGTLKHTLLGEGVSPVEVRNGQCVGGPLAILDSYYGTYTTCPDDAQWRLDLLKENYVPYMTEDYVFPKVFMTEEDTELVTQYTTDIKQYTDQMKATWIMNGGIENDWDAYLEKLEGYGLSKYLEIKQKYCDEYYK